MKIYAITRWTLKHYAKWNKTDLKDKYWISTWDDEKVLELVMMIAQHCDVMNDTELYT